MSDMSALNPAKQDGGGGRSGARRLGPTPQICWPCSGRPDEVWVKHENTCDRRLKVRGGVIYMARLRKSEPGVTGVIAATRGNHGKASPRCRAHGLNSTIVVPEATADRRTPR